jgi:lipoprotein Spr
MIKNSTYFLLAAFLFSNCTGLKTLTGSDNKQPSRTNASADNGNTAVTGKREIKFLDDISADPVASGAGPSSANKTKSGPVTVKKEMPATTSAPIIFSKPNLVEAASPLQLKYAILLNTEVENVPSTELLKKIDEWYGTRYCMGGTTSRCIDCSAFMQILFASVYGISLPRTAREQYKNTTRISRTELQEGDLVFFNTRGGVSHVGFYLQNNKFVHASTNGVMISDLFENYYLRRFVGVGRVDKPVSLSVPATGNR